jgi:hypothetical protein
MVCARRDFGVSISGGIYYLHVYTFTSSAMFIVKYVHILEQDSGEFHVINCPKHSQRVS